MPSGLTRALTPYVPALLSGVLMVLAFPSAGLNALAWVCLVPLILAVLLNDRPGAARQGAAAGAIYHAGLVYWVIVAMKFYGGVPGPAAGVLLVLLALLLSVFVALPLWCSCFIQRRTGIRLTLTLPACWVASEYIKSWALTGFPWELLGYSQFQNLRIIQVADITGVYGVSFLLVSVNCAVAALVHSLIARRRPAWIEPCCAIVLTAACLVYGAGRLREFREPQGSPISAVIVQPNIPQHLKWNPAYLDETLGRLYRLSTAKQRARTDIIIWPESATPFFFQNEPVYRRRVEETARHSGAWLLFGSPSFVSHPAGDRYFNSAFMLSPGGSVTGRYDKLHLVPWGEYVPLQRLFPFISKMVAGIGDFSPGRGIEILRAADTSLATLICYEIIFPNLTRRFIRRGGQCIVNITNDAWFGRTSAPYQHLSMAVLRAVENKRFLLRAANTGISAVIGPAGDIRAHTALLTEAVLQAEVIPLDGLTVYSRFGDIFAAACLLASALLMMAAWLRRRNKPAA